MKNVVYVFGTSGVGKTTLLSKLLEDFSEKIEYLSFGTIMFEIGKIKYNLKVRDDLRKLKKEDYYSLFLEAVEQLEELVLLSDKKLIVVDTHVLIDTSFGTFIGSPKFLIKKVPPTAVVFISANPKEIVKRAKNDKTRKRNDLLDLEKIKIRLDLTRNTSFIIAYETHALFKEIENKEGKLDEAYKELKSFIKNFL